MAGGKTQKHRSNAEANKRQARYDRCVINSCAYIVYNVNTRDGQQNQNCARRNRPVTSKVRTKHEHLEPRKVEAKAATYRNGPARTGKKSGVRLDEAVVVAVGGGLERVVELGEVHLARAVLSPCHAAREGPVPEDILPAVRVPGLQHHHHRQTGAR